MKVSIIIPAYNEAQYIEQTLEAVVKLDYPDVEIIVADNNSTDDTVARARKFPQVKVVTETNKGANFARERGRKEAQGEILACIDADCRPDPQWLKRGVELFNTSKIVAVSGPYDYYDSSLPFRVSSYLVQRIFYSVINEVFQLFHIGSLMIAGNSLIRAETLEKIGGYDTSFTFYGDDTNTAKRLSRCGKIRFSGRVVMKTSARRFKNEGTIKIFFMYIYHFLKVIFSEPKKLS